MRARVGGGDVDHDVVSEGAKGPDPRHGRRRALANMGYAEAVV